MAVVDDESYYDNVVHDIFSNKGLNPCLLKNQT